MRWGSIAVVVVVLAGCACFVHGGTNQWAVIVATSRFWHNYRHSANPLSIYHTLKRGNLGDANILLLLGDHHACDPRNIYPGTIINDRDKRTNLYDCNVAVDLTGYQVNVRNTLHLLQGLVDPVSTPLSRRLESDSSTNMLVYLTGHGGNGFLKFQDAEFMTAEDLGQTLTLMYQRGRYQRLLIIIETCQGESLCLHITAPNVVCVTSSHIGEDSRAHHMDPDIGVAVIDQFSYHTLAFFTEFHKLPQGQQESVTLRQWLSYYKGKTFSHVYHQSTNPHAMDSWRIAWFFGTSVASRAGDTGHRIEVVPPRPMSELFGGD